MDYISQVGSNDYMYQLVYILTSLPPPASWISPGSHLTNRNARSSLVPGRTMVFSSTSISHLRTWTRAVLRENEEKDLSRAVGEWNEVIYKCCPEPYLDITYTLHLIRKPTSQIQKYLVPSGLVDQQGQSGGSVQGSSSEDCFAVLWMYLLCFGVYFTRTVATRFPVVK